MKSEAKRKAYSPRIAALTAADLAYVSGGGFGMGGGVFGATTQRTDSSSGGWSGNGKTLGLDSPLTEQLLP